MSRRTSWARDVSIGLCLLMVPATAYADDCSYTSPGDCYDQFMIALLVIAALVLLIAVGWEMLLAAGALESAAAVLAAEAAEAAEVTTEVTELSEVTELTDLSEATEATEITTEAEEATAEAEEVTTEGTSGADEAAKVQSWLDRIRGLNWSGGGKNCWPLSRGVSQMVATGSELDTSGLIDTIAEKGTTLGDAAAQVGSTAERMGFAQIESALQAAGPGSQGFVAVFQEGVDGQVVGHVFNVVNDAGTVIFIDAQSTAVATSGTAVAAASGYGSAASTFFIPLF
jgi:hypothetical protein